MFWSEDAVTHCDNKPCQHCTCGRVTYACVGHMCANSNFGPVERPKGIVRRDPVAAAKRLAVRFEESLKILA